MIDIFKLLFTILFATYVYKNSKLPTYAKLYKPLIMNGLLFIAYNTIYYYSSVEIHINKLLTIIDPYVDLLKEYIMKNDKSIYIIEMFKDGVKTYDIITDKHIIEDNALFLEREFDLIVISDFTKPNPINKLCINNIPNNIKDYELSDIRFLSFKLIYKNDIDFVVDIELSNNKYNFYVVNNVLDKAFFKYYVTNISQLNLPSDFSYNIELIDNNINMHVLDDTYSITICKNDYEINKVHCLSIEEEVEEVKEEALEEEVEEVKEQLEEQVEEQVEEALEEVKERINSDEFVKLDKTNCIDF